MIGACASSDCFLSSTCLSVGDISSSLSLFSYVSASEVVLVICGCDSYSTGSEDLETGSDTSSTGSDDTLVSEYGLASSHPQLTQ